MTARRTIAVVTGTRAEYGLLRTVMRAIQDHRDLDLKVLVTGTHLLTPALTVREVAATFEIVARIPMQSPGDSGHAGEARALGRGISGFADWLDNHDVDVVVVLGDRIEAFAAASAAAVCGIRVAHTHGGDRAAGIHDEGLRHAVTKLAHIHLPATTQSAQRIRQLGEDPSRIHVVGSPAIDGLEQIPPLADPAYEALGCPQIVFLLHPSGLHANEERDLARQLLKASRRQGRVLALHPNHDPGREAILETIEHEMEPSGIRDHLPRDEFVALLRRVSLLVGNSSAGLIEAAAIGVRCLNAGPRQDGRERPDNVIDLARPAGPAWGFDEVIARGLSEPAGPISHPYGDGSNGGAGGRIARLLATFDPAEHRLTKRNTY